VAPASKPSAPPSAQKMASQRLSSGTIKEQPQAGALGSPVQPGAGDVSRDSVTSAAAPVPEPPPRTAASSGTRANEPSTAGSKTGTSRAPIAASNPRQATTPGRTPATATRATPAAAPTQRAPAATTRAPAAAPSAPAAPPQPPQVSPCSPQLAVLALCKN
jgi:hypothetical protein